MKKNTAVDNAPIRPLGPVLLLALSAGASLLALFQWMELLVVRAGGSAICGVSDTINCEAVWNSPFATRLHQGLGMPVAALGLVWGLSAFALSLWLAYRAQSRQPVEVPATAVRFTAAVGALSCISFAVASLRAGSLCLTCVATYLLVLGFTAVAFFLLPGPALPQSQQGVARAVGASVAAALVFYLSLLWPGLQTPGRQNAAEALAKAAKAAEQVHATKEMGKTGQAADPHASGRVQQAQGPATATGPLADFLAQLPWAQQQALSDSLTLFKAAEPKDNSAYPTRRLFGEKGAPLKIVEFVDIRCGHCGQLVQTLSQLKRIAPKGSFSLEARHFPLDRECNSSIPGTDHSGVRCLGAKAQICLESAPDFWELREKLFAEQHTLTKDRVMEIASSGATSRAALQQCVNSPDTARKLQQDIEYALRYNPTGTPLVLLNDRMGTPVGAFLYAMALTGGNPDAAAFQVLPASRPGLQDDPHAGHMH